MKLYSYQPPEQIKFDTLAENALWFSHPSKFNDVFEMGAPTLMTPAVNPPSQAYGVLNLALECKRDNHVLYDDDWFNSMSLLAKFLEDSYQEHKVTSGELTRLQSEYVHKIKTQIGVMCFSKSPLSQLMWAYYAKSHEGFCVEFDIDTNNLELVKLYGRDVNYVTTKPMVDIWQLLFSDFSEQIVFTKSMEWAHESEYRIAANLKVQTRKGVCLLSNDKGFKIKKPKEIKVTKLICGVKMSLHHKSRLEDVAKALQKKQRSKVEVVEVKEHPSRYELTLVKLANRFNPA